MWGMNARQYSLPSAGIRTTTQHTRRSTPFILYRVWHARPHNFGPEPRQTAALRLYLFCTMSGLLDLTLWPFALTDSNTAPVDTHSTCGRILWAAEQPSAFTQKPTCSPIPTATLFRLWLASSRCSCTQQRILETGSRMRGQS